MRKISRIAASPLSVSAAVRAFSARLFHFARKPQNKRIAGDGAQKQGK